MVNFNSETDRQLFLLEVGKRIDEQDNPEDHKRFIKKRSFVVPLLKDFRKSQAAKRAWTTNRLDYIFGLKHWAHSTEGRRFHRNLGKFITTRIDVGRVNLSVKEDAPLSVAQLIELRMELLKELQTYKTLEENVNLELLIEEISEALN